MGEDQLQPVLNTSELCPGLDPDDVVSSCSRSPSTQFIGLMLTVFLLAGLPGCGTIPVLVVGPRLEGDQKPRSPVVGNQERPVPRDVLADGDAHKDSPSGRIRAAQAEADRHFPEGSFSIDEAVLLATQNNPTLRQAVAQVEGEEGKAIQAGLYPNPLVGYANINIGLDNADPGGVDGSMAQFGFIQQEFVSGGKLRLSRQKFLARVSAAEFEALTQMYTVTNSVKIEFLEVLGQQRRLAIQKERLKTAQDLLVTIQEMFNVGQANRADLHLAQVRVQEVELAVLNAENELREEWEDLVTVIGHPLPPRALGGNLEADFPPLDFDEQYERILEQSPMLARAEALRKSEEIKVERELVEPIPNLNVLAGGGRAIGRFNTAHVIAQADIPVFDWNQGTVLQAKADLRRQENEIPRLELMFRRMLAEQFEKYLTALQHVRAFQTVVLPQRQEAYTTALKSYHEDRETWPVVLQTQDTFFLHRLMYIEHLVAWRTARVAIEGLLLVDGLMPPMMVTGPGHINAVPKPR